MAALKLLNLLAITSLALLANFTATPVNALSLESRHPRHVHRSHVPGSLKKKRAPARRCKATSTAAAPSQTPGGNNGGSNSGSSGGSNTGSGNNGGSSTPSSPPPPPPPPPSGGGKAGIAWANWDDTKVGNVVGWKTKYFYDWAAYIPPNVPQLGLNAASMYWGDKSTQDWQYNHPPNAYQFLLAFNEPDQGGQSNMDPWHAADLWRAYIQPYKWQGKTLISPACTNAPAGKQWMSNFFTACSGCDVDIVALHFYGTSASDFIGHLQDYHNSFGRPLWITEFACHSFGGPQVGYDQVYAFMKDTVGFMDGTDWVYAYFWFGMLTDMVGVNEANRLMTPDFQLTDLGHTYVGNRPFY